jgi:hypothetical protein
MRFVKTRWDESTTEIRPYQKRIEYDDDVACDVVIIADDRLTSEAADARLLESRTLEFTPLEVEWLHKQLGKLLRKWHTPALEERQHAAPALGSIDVLKSSLDPSQLILRGTSLKP